jgi:hypothetical protein
MIATSINRRLGMLLVCGSVLYCGCTFQAQTGGAEKIPRYANSFLYCRPMAYAPDVAELVPECKPDPPGSKVYQLTTTVWTSRASSSTASSPDRSE